MSSIHSINKEIDNILGIDLIELYRFDGIRYRSYSLFKEYDLKDIDACLESKLLDDYKYYIECLTIVSEVSCRCREYYAQKCKIYYRRIEKLYEELSNHSDFVISNVPL